LRPDGSSCFPYASDAIQMVYRVTPEEVREDASKVFANLHPDDLDEVNATILQSAKDLSPWKQDYRTKFEDGTIRYLFGNSMPQLEADGSVLWHGFITDITERKQMEEDLKQSELRFRTLIEWTPNAVLIHGRMKIIYANPAAVTLFGATSLQELTGTSIWDRIDPYYHPIVRERITSGMDAPMMEVRYLKLDETVVEAEVRGTNIIYDGMPCLHASITDITQRKKEEEKLRNSHARLASMTANISDVIGIMGADGLMKYKSANIEKFFGWTPEERVGSSGYTTIHPDDLDRVQTIFLSLIGEENAVKTLEFRYECKDGSYKPIELTAANLLNDPVINGILLNYRDITERNTREGKINLQNEELHKLNTQKDKFFSIIAHDLRGPISGFMQLAELLADEEQAKTDSETSEMIADLSHSARNTFNLLENLLEWSQINSGNFNFNPKKIGLSSLVQECTAILAEQARAKEIGFTIEIANGLEVFADKDMLQTVVRNLLSNALKYSHKGGQVIILAKSVKENQTMVSVKDTGIGMTEAMKNNLFRIDANTKRRSTQGESSTGLGLQLCKEFVEIQGGKMSIESEQNVGSEFSFTIVSADPSQKKVESKKPVLDEIGKSTLKQLNVLIVEDDDITYSMLKRVVRNVSKEVYRAFSGAEAIEICHTMTDLDLILMDLRLPIMDGYEATRQIRMFNKEVVIIAQTAQASDKYKNIALDAGCNDYITKPVDNKRLMEMILYHCLAKE
jgi:PAS domain S-box-containing protein